RRQGGCEGRGGEGRREAPRRRIARHARHGRPLQGRREEGRGEEGRAEKVRSRMSRMRRVHLASLMLGLALPATAAAEIVRCAAPDGRVTYQQIPCESGTEARVGIPSEYPAPNSTERDRLLAREAALDRRLEAERERWQQDAALRAAREEREL